MALRRAALLAAALVLAGMAGWRIVVTATSDRLAADHPGAALAWDADNPDAVLTLARQQLQAGHPQDAAAIARRLLRTEPLQGPAFVMLARAAQAEGDDAAAHKLFAIALRRAPRDQYTRAWTIGAQLRVGNYDDALRNTSVLLRIAPPRQEVLIPVLAQLTEKPAFASALAHTLAEQPQWRWAMLGYLLSHASHNAVDAVFSRLQDLGSLSDGEAAQWFDRLTAAGLWGEAYSRWASGLHLPRGTPLPSIYDGGFETKPSGIGFDWRTGGAPGVIIERVQVDGATGSYAAQVSFFGRRVTDTHFAQTLLLAAGPHVLRFRARARRLTSDKGLEWAIGCEGIEEPIASSPRLRGDFAWRPIELTFTVPEHGCPAQRLWLRNPGAAGAAKIVSGTLWFDDFRIAAPAPAASAAP